MQHNVNSTAPTLNVSAAPTITTQPVAQTICAGSSVTFSVVANNATGYQWQKGGVNIWGATSSSYTINPVAGTDAGNYGVIVSGAAPCGSVTSSIVALTVNSPAAITANPNSVTVCSTSGTSFTAAASGTSVGLQWQISTNGGGSWSSVQMEVLHIAVLLTGTLAISNTAGLNGNQYRLLATTASPCSNSVNSTAATLNVSAAPTITTQPIAQTICAGSSVTFSVVANNATGYQWQKGGVNIGGATSSSYTINPVATTDAGNYSVIVSGAAPCGSVTSSIVALTVNTPPATAGVTICQGGSGSLTSSASCAASIPGTLGPNFAGTGASGTGIGTLAWSGTTNIFSNDGNSATATVSSGGNTIVTTQYLQATNFGFSIPANAFITGIQVSINRFSSQNTGSNNVQDNIVSLIKAGVVTGNDNSIAVIGQLQHNCG